MNLRFKKILNYMLLILASYVLISISACENKPVSETSGVNLDSFEAKDQGNENNASDIRIFCEFSGSLDKYEKVRFILVVSPSDLDRTKALSLPPGSYVETDLAKDIEPYLSSETKDADGAPISEGKSYITFMLLLPAAGEPLLIKASQTLTLVDEIVVTTPKFKGTVSADEDISTDTEGNLYVAGGKSNPTTLFRISKDGTINELTTSLSYPVGNTLDDESNLYVTNYQSTTINFVTPTGETSAFITDAKLTGGGDIILDKDGVVYNTFYSTKSIYKISGGSLEDFLTSDKLNGPVGLAYDPVNDRIFVSNFNDGKIFEVLADESISEIADTPASIGHLDYQDGVFYATGYKENKVYLVSTSGEILATIGNGNKGTTDGISSEASFFAPNGIAVSKDGKFVYVSQMDGILRKIIL